MSPVLSSEVLARIAHHVREPKVHSPCTQGEDEEEVKIEQATLLAMMLSSRVSWPAHDLELTVQDVYEAVKSEVYLKCTVGNIEKFVNDIKADEPYASIQHLHFYRPTSTALSYRDLLACKVWKELSYKTAPKGQDIDGHASASIRYEDSIAEACNQFRDKVFLDGKPVLPNLKSITLGGLGTTGTKDWSDMQHSGPMYAGVTKRGLPVTLLETVAFDSFCQYDNEGPLTLPGTFWKPPHPVSTFTYHPRRCPHNRPKGLNFADAIPIIIGATNRLYYEPLTVIDPGSICTCCQDRPLLKVLSPLLNAFHPSLSQVLGLGGDGDIWDCLDVNNFDLRNTTVEVYNLVRLVSDQELVGMMKSRSQDKDKMRKKDGKLVASAPPGSLARFQAVLDRHIHPKWRGRVVLKNREDAPPCPSCGLNLEEEFGRRQYNMKDLHQGR